MSRRHVLRTICVAVACSLALGSAPGNALGAVSGGVAGVAVPTSRISGPNRYATAALSAGRAYPGWNGVRHVVIASGEALSDAAVASSLCWAYDAPLLLVSNRSVPSATREALAAIVSANPGVAVHVVGSSSAITAGCVARIKSAAMGSSAVEQPWKKATRYSLAGHVAARVRTVAAQSGRAVPKVALVANGSDPKRLWDAAAASSVSRHTGVPLLLTATNAVPVSTTRALLQAGRPRVIVVGGGANVAPAVYSKLRANERWGGATRYSTAVAVAGRASARQYSAVTTFGVAATIPDAVAGAQLPGSAGGVLLFSGRDRIEKTTWTFLSARASSLGSAYTFGGGVSGAQVAELRGAAAMPWFESGAPGRYVGKKFRVTGRVGGNTTTVAVYVRGKKVRSAKVKAWGRFNFTSIPMPASSTRVSLVADSPDGQSSKTSRDVKRLKYPSATCIVIDKSDFKLYWVRDNRLVQAFPIAIGRSGMETPAPAKWKILAKYHTSPGSVYGPRKMRMFRQRGGHYAFTAYAIHGTNQEWVIGTKASHGCIRMYNRDVRKLFPQVPIGTMVYTRR